LFIPGLLTQLPKIRQHVESERKSVESSLSATKL
jgi:hypothetical protein